MTDLEKVKLIADCIHVPEEFGINETSDDFGIGYDLLYDQMMDARKIYDFGKFEIYNGATKAAIVIEDLDYVIKVPFTGMWFEEKFYDEEKDEYTYSDPIFEKFYGPANYGLDNYCEMELERINNAVYEGFGDIVAYTVPYYGVILQEKITPFKDTLKETRATPSEKSKNFVSTLDDSYKLVSEEWIGLTADLYGDEYWKDFVDWVNREGNGILDDMYGANYGYRLDGSPVLFDISGFEDR